MKARMADRMGERNALTLDELGEQIATLAAHVQAAMCRWLTLVAEFDEREGWAPWGCHSCAHWISWRCSIAPGAAREHVRVARRLQTLPLIRESFGRGELSYSKVRALTRVENVHRERELLELARASTAAQLERIVRSYRRVLDIDAAQVYAQRSLSIVHDDDGSVVLRGRFPREEGALLIKAIEAMRDREPAATIEPICHNVPAGTPSGESLDETRVQARPTCPPVDAVARNADALVLLAEEALAGDGRTIRNGGDRYQVVVHVDAVGLQQDREPEHCELDDGAPLAPQTVRRISCDAAIVPMIKSDGKPLSVGRKTRSIPPALRRALQTRDRGCRFPGCQHHRWVDAHHIQHWADGGATDMDNLIQLCRHHHRLLHEGCYTVQRRADESFVFRRADGRVIPQVPYQPPGHVATIHAGSRDAGLRMTADTSVPLWYGDRLDLPAAIDAMLAIAPPATSDASSHRAASTGGVMAA